jgi:hypothetical protein
MLVNILVLDDEAFTAKFIYFTVLLQEIKKQSNKIKICTTQRVKLQAKAKSQALT